jgi:hypothetical protein
MAISRLASPTLLAVPALVLVLAGCFSDRGVALEVDVGDTGATLVELYLGAEHCDPRTNTARITCATIAPPPDGKLALAGDVWFRDGLAPETAQVKGHKATFQLRTELATTLPIVVAVGFADGQGTTAVGAVTLHDLSIPVHSARVIATTLAPAIPAQPGTTTRTQADRVLVWRKTTPASSCVMIEHGGTLPVARDFVVPADDPDCDDVVDDAAMHECNPAAYLGTSMVGGARGRPECFTSSGGPACVLGGFGCKDNVPGNDSSCAPLGSRTCVPDAFCNCATFDEACTRAQLGTAARIECQVPTLLSVGAIGLCPNRDQAAIDLGVFFTGGECAQPEIGVLPGIGFDDRHSFGGATMKLSSPSRPCQFTIAWSDGTRPRLAATDDFGVLRFEPDTGATLLLPIVFHFLPPADNCVTSDFTCKYLGAPTDALWSCVR